jgi:peptidylprolyl isomerase
VREGFYDGLAWHRVIPSFMAQGGDPDGNGQGGSGQKLEAEFSDLMHFRGMVSMARADAENSADSQFFICLGFVDHLDGKYTIWGEVVDGMVFVDNIKEGVVPAMTDPDKIVKMQIMADVVKK